MGSISPTKLGLDPALLEPGTPEAIYCEAYQKAETALTYAFVEFGGEPSYCGFAWVLIKPARGPFVKFLKRHGMGDTGVYGGWEISSPGGYNGQSMDLKEAACRAFAEVLKAHGINAYMKSRAD